MTLIYLDFNSTTPLDHSVAEAMYQAALCGFANPASQHQPGQFARRRLEQARTELALMVGLKTTGMNADRLIFTSGGTESNNLAIRGLAGTDRSKQILISAIEHPSVIGTCEWLASDGWQVRKIPVDQNGVCRLDELKKMLERPTALVSLMLANNETGVLQPVAKAAQICRAFGVPIHTDAVQAVGKVPVSFVDLGVTSLTFTAHKFHGPRGIGALAVRHDALLSPIQFGGFQQQGLRPGTEDVVLAVGFQSALELAVKRLNNLAARFLLLRNLMLATLEQDLIEPIVVNGAGVERVPHTLNISFPGLDRQALLIAADFAGIAISTGSACASGSSEPSPVLVAMGLPAAVIEGSIRISFGAPTTEAEVVAAAARISQIANDLRRQPNRPK